jgi:PAS domain S-box-containing protein/putative nucleotidyltransferase with HDIG domain
MQGTAMKTGEKSRKNTGIRKMKCWEVFSCEERDCPAYKSRNLKCWLFTGTHCRKEIQGTFIEKMEMCFDCKVFKKNIDAAGMWNTCLLVNTQFKEFVRMVKERDRELENLGMEMSISLSEVFEALKKISTGDPAVRIDETSQIELIRQLKHMINLTAENIGEIVDQSHEIAIGLAEHFDLLHRVSKGELQARATGDSPVELLESLGKVTNTMIESIDEEIKERHRTEESLREMEALESSILSAIPHAVMGLRDRVIIFANESVRDVFGWSPAELIGNSTRVLYRSDEDYEEIGKYLYPIIAVEKTHSMEFPCRRKDGTDILCKLTTAVIGERLTNEGIVVVYEDITERRVVQQKLIHAAEEWRTTFDSMPYGVLLLDRDFRIIRANKYVSAMCGIPLPDMTGKLYNETIYAGGPDNGSPALLDAGYLTPLEYYDKRLNKHFVHYVTPIPDEKGLTQNFVLSLVDISDMKEKENALIKSKNAFFNMLKELDTSHKELKGMYEGIIHSFVNAIDAKSPWTKGHSERVTHYSLAIARALGLKGKNVDLLRIAALLHDVGKIGTYDVILEKPGKLTDEEFALIRMHPVRGEEILKPIRHLSELLPIVRHHHERLDGRGYPDGLKNNEIPFFSKIICIADSFDAMTADRPYRASPSREYAISELQRCRGTQFDPQAVDAFLHVLSEKGNRFGSTRGT